MIITKEQKEQELVFMIREYQTFHLDGKMGSFAQFRKPFFCYENEFTSSQKS